MSFLRCLRLCVASLCCMLSLGIAAPAHAETSEVRAAQQFGLSYLALMMMEVSKLVEKQAKTMCLGDIKVSWAKLGGPGAINDAPFSVGINFHTGGGPPLITPRPKADRRPQEGRGA